MMISPRKISLVAERDFWAIVQTRSFLIGFLIVLLMASLMPIMLALSGARASYRIAVLDPTGSYAPQLQNRLTDRDFTLIDLSGAKNNLDETRKAGLISIRKKVYFAMLEVTPQSIGEEKFILYCGNLADAFPRQILEELLTDIVRHRRAVQLGISQDQLESVLAPVNLTNFRISPRDLPEKTNEKDFLYAYLFPIGLVFSLYGIISFQSERLLTALLEEKTKRLIEVLLTRASVYELLLGKILGILYVGGILYAGILLLLCLASWTLGFTHLITLKALLFYTLFYIGGYGIYASFYATVGAACTNQKDAENFSMPIRIVLIIPITISVYVNAHPEAISSVFCSYFPLTAPFVMTNRMAVSEIPMRELVLSLALVMITVWTGIWIATRVFRASVLAQGRPLGLGDVWRSLRSLKSF